MKYLHDKIGDKSTNYSRVEPSLWNICVVSVIPEAPMDGSWEEMQVLK